MTEKRKFTHCKSVNVAQMSWDNVFFLSFPIKLMASGLAQPKEKPSKVSRRSATRGIDVRWWRFRISELCFLSFTCCSVKEEARQYKISVSHLNFSPWAPLFNNFLKQQLSQHMQYIIVNVQVLTQTFYAFVIGNDCGGWLWNNHNNIIAIMRTVDCLSQYWIPIGDLAFSMEYAQLKFSVKKKIYLFI